MRRPLPGVLALVALPLLGCDAVDFPPLVEPAPEPGLATIQLRYAHGDSLGGNLAVFLRSWLAPGSTAQVLLDGRPVPRVESQAPDAAFQDTWTLAPQDIESLPQILALPALAGEPMLVPLPVLVRQGSAVICVAADDPILRFSETAVPQPAARSWTVQLGGSDALVIQGQGRPPNPLRLPRELLGPMAEPRSVSLFTTLHTHAEVGDAVLVMSAALLAHWTLVGNGSDDLACTGPS